MSRRDFLLFLLLTTGAVVIGPRGRLLAAQVPGAAAWPRGWPVRGTPLAADPKTGTVAMYAEISLRHLTETTTHWGIGCETGKFADRFILVSPAEPPALYDALIRIGARPGNNLAPDGYGKTVEGDVLALTAAWPGLPREVDAGGLFYDSSGKGFRFRFGGNRRAAEEQRTGCLTCLESCPVGITSNAVYPHLSTARRIFRPNSRFRGRPEVLPAREAFPLVVFYRLAGKG
ncbi:MAG: hypothetical protein HPY65_05725 [Syntrophaceae bacterium]|nr:hypothetical protein [Syntrophaceae bacterium]